MGINNGVMSEADYGGQTCSSLFGYQETIDYYFGWPTGYKKWFDAMHNRMKGFMYGNYFGNDWLGARESLKQWLWNHWGEDGYIEGGCAGIGVASGLSAAKIPSTPTNNKLGVSGKYYVTHWGVTYDHALTVVGYDDRIEFDLNGNGVYGEESADEKGAWIICNSWGNTWMNQGFIYCPYANSYCTASEDGKQQWSPWAPELYTYRHNYRPYQTIKVLMDYDHRWEVNLSAGIAQDTAAANPEATTTFTHFTGTTIYNGSDGHARECPMLGKWVDGFHYEPMEFGYDLTELASRFDRTRPLKYFFIVKTPTNAVGKGHIYNASILNYEYDPTEQHPLEFPLTTDTVAIDSGGVTLRLTVIVPGESLNAPFNATLSGNTLTWSAPEPTSIPQQKYYIYKNGVLADSTPADRLSYTVKDASASYSVAAIYNFMGSPTASPLSNSASQSVVLNNTDNKVLTLKGQSLTIPNAITSSLPQATIEFWIKPNSLSANVNKVKTETGDFYINLLPAGQVSAGWGSNSQDNATSAASSIKTGKWQHVAVTIDKGALSVYIDGMKKKTVYSESHSGLSATGNIVIGDGDGGMDATIDELRIWNTARTFAEIYGSKDKAVANPGASSQLMIYMPMDSIEDEGQIKIRDYVSGKHAILSATGYAFSSDNSILNGSTYALKSSIRAAQDSAEAGVAVKYTAVSPVSTASWLWSTPGAAQSTYTSQSPYITYNKAGNYTITLTLTDADGSTQELTKEVSIKSAAAPVVDFDLSQPNGEVGSQITLINRSSGSNTAYTWTLEGSEQPTVKATNATVVYNTPGTYTITLTGQNVTGTTSKQKTVVITPAAPQADFTITPNTILLGEQTYLNDKSLGAPYVWEWTLDNGHHKTTIDGQNTSYKPTHPGIYNVSLNVGNDVARKTKTLARNLIVSNADAKSSLAFSGAQTVSFDCPLTKNSKSWTIEWWMQPLQYDGAGSFALDNGFFSMTGLGDGVYQVSINGSYSNSQKDYVKINEWHHYAVSYNVGTIRLYRDGELIETLPNKINYATGKWEGTMTISSESNRFKGMIDELRIWGKALNVATIQSVANQPISDPENTANLKLYYNFNDGTGDVSDLSASHLNGTRTGFGPDGDAWPVSPGVFTLDLDPDATVTTDVSAQYLTNYKAPFLYDEATQVNTNPANRFYALQTGNAQSTWQLTGNTTDGDITTGFHVDRTNNFDFSCATGYNDFATDLQDCRAWQTATLPQGRYTFSVKPGLSNGDYSKCYLVVGDGDAFPTSSTLSDALTFTSLKDNTSVSFTLNEETPLTFGVIYNLNGWGRYNVDAFSLVRENVEIIKANGETGIYDAVRNGHADVITPKDGGILIASEQKQNFQVFTLDGRCVMNEDVHGVHFIPLQPGIYVCNGQKFQVK